MSRKRSEARGGRHLAAYRALMVLYPRRFRREFGPLMEQAFADRLREARGATGRIAMPRFWRRMAVDLVRSSTRERVDAITHLQLRPAGATTGRSGMGRYAIRRVLSSIPVLLVASILVFVVVRASTSPTAAIALNPRCDAACKRNFITALGLDKSGYHQYVAWLSHFVKGNWGVSTLSRQPVARDIREALMNTAVLGLTAELFSLLIGVAIGVYSAIRQYSAFDHLATGGAFVGLSIPNFWFALLLQIFFGLYLTRWLHLSSPIFYTAGMFKPGSQGFHLLDRVRHLFLPALVLAVQIIAVYSRYIRASMLEVLHSDYMRTARAKGLKERRVIVRHAMRNALIPLTTQWALNIGALAGGLVITETIFQWPGMGKFFIDALNNGDYAQVLPWVMVTVAFVILFNLIADILYAVLDPRIRYA